MNRGETGPPVVVLDDDPTGAQGLAGVTVLLAWTTEEIQAAAKGRRALHLLTNTRSMSAELAYQVTREAAAAAQTALPTAPVILRGDSTLRAHVREEYLGLCDGRLGGRRPPLLLVPALPQAGRVTAGGIHYLVQGGSRTPLHLTEYARDGSFAYQSSRLLAWAEERSGGLFAVGDGLEIPLSELRSRGPAAVAEALGRLAACPRPAVCAPDAENLDDLSLVAAGIERALVDRVESVTRCGPALVGAWTGSAASVPVPAPPASHGILVVFGSYLQASTSQLTRLLDVYPRALVEVDVIKLFSQTPEREIARAASAVDSILKTGPVAVLATPRNRPRETMSLEAGYRIAVNLARVLRVLNASLEVVIVKGGITSAITLRHGVGATAAEVVGPILPGVSLWRPAGKAMPAYVIVPGNVGSTGLLEDVVAKILGR